MALARPRHDRLFQTLLIDADTSALDRLSRTSHVRDEAIVFGSTIAKYKCVLVKGVYSTQGVVTVMIFCNDL